MLGPEDSNLRLRFNSATELARVNFRAVLKDLPHGLNDRSPILASVLLASHWSSQPRWQTTFSSLLSLHGFFHAISKYAWW